VIDQSADPRAISQVAGRIIGELAPETLTALPTVSTAFFANKATRRRVVRAVTGRARETPAAFDETTPDLLGQVVLVILNGVAAQVLVDATYRGLKGLRARWRRRRLASRLTARAADGANTPVPTFANEVAVRVTEASVWIAVRAGVPARTVSRLEVLLTVELSETDDGP
jgi:hypothetical protein